MDPGSSRHDGGSPKQQAWPSALGDPLEVPAPAVSMEVEPRPDEIPGGSPKEEAWPSALGDVLDVPPLAIVSMEVEPRPDEISGSGELPLATPLPPHVVPSPALDGVVTAVGGGGASSSMAQGGHQDLSMVVADASRIRTVGSANDRFVLISDVKAMLQTGCFEGQQVANKNKRTKLADEAGELPLAIYQPHVVPSPALNEMVTAVGEGASSSMAPGNHQDLSMVGADTIRIQTVGAANDRFVPISDVKAMLQTGRFEGQQVAYKNKRTKQNLLHGTIHGTTYFCSCGDDCDHNGKALSARAFELHAVKNGKETHNPNDHIVLSSSNITLFEACRRLKEAKNEAVQEATFGTILKGDHRIFPKHNVKAPVMKISPDDNSDMTGLVRNLEKRMESTEKRMENLESQVNTIEKNIDFFCKEMVRYQALFQDVSKILGKFVDDM